MNRKKENNIKYSVSDIQKYLEGKLSPSEMHAIESAALNDEFLADAIEGIELYNTNDAGDFNADIEQLGSIIKNKRKNKYGPVLWKAAAIIMVVATAIALTFNQNKSVNKTEVLADKNIESKKEKEVIMPSTILADTIKKKNASENKIILKSSSRQTRQIPSPAPVYLEKEIMGTDTFVPVDLSTYPKPGYASPKALQAMQGKVHGVSINDEIDEKQKTFSGFVKDEKGNPVAGASVSIKGTLQGTVTDEKGSFKLKDNGEDSSLNVLVNSIGFNDAEKRVFLDKPSGNEIILYNSYSAGLDEVIITGYGVSKKRKSAVENDLVSENPGKAVPITGWKDYQKYLQQNKRLDSVEKTISGRVTLSFAVNEKGIPYDFSIERSLSPFYDQEAIRLIKEGPRWKLRNSKTAKLSVNIDF